MQLLYNIIRYNSYRPHTALGYKTPNQTEDEYFMQITEIYDENTDKKRTVQFFCHEKSYCS